MKILKQFKSALLFKPIEGFNNEFTAPIGILAWLCIAEILTVIPLIYFLFNGKI